MMRREITCLFAFNAHITLTLPPSLPPSVRSSLPGDIASNPSNFRAALAAARRRFHATFIVAGNHDLWVSSALAEEGVVDSIDKLAWVHKVAAEEDEDGREDGEQKSSSSSSSSGSSSSSRNKRGKIYTGPVLLHLPPHLSLPPSLLLLVPLLSWYHPSWDTEPDLPAEILAELYKGRPSFEQCWADFRYCKWPEEVVRGEGGREGGREEWVSTTTRNRGIAEWFAKQNEGFLEDARVRVETREGGREGGRKVVVISFSHFLPREELCPEKRFLIEPMLTKVIGSRPLREQVERLKPDLHLFGHTHIPLDIEVGGIRYLQWPLGSVGEQGRQTGEMSLKGPVVVFDSKGGEGGWEGGLQGEVPTRWGAHYKEEGRDVLKTELAPWVKMYWNRR